MVVLKTALKRGIRRAAASMGVDIRRIARPGTLPSVRGSVLADHSVSVVIDGGAYIGEWAAEVRDGGFRGEILSFEPLTDPFATLQERAAADPGWKAERLALGERSQTAEMEVAGNPASSSLLCMNETHLAAAPQSSPTGRETVEVKRLDEVLPAERLAGRPCYLKLDLQGYESTALKGARGIIDSIVAIELELSLVSLYKGDETLPEMFEQLDAAGFVCVGVFPDFMDPRRNRILQENGVFERSPGA